MMGKIVISRGYNDVSVFPVQMTACSTLLVRQEYGLSLSFTRFMRLPDYRTAAF